LVAYKPDVPLISPPLAYVLHLCSTCVQQVQTVLESFIQLSMQPTSNITLTILHLILKGGLLYEALRSLMQAAAASLYIKRF